MSKLGIDYSNFNQDNNSQFKSKLGIDYSKLDVSKDVKKSIIEQHYKAKLLDEYSSYISDPMQYKKDQEENRIKDEYIASFAMAEGDYEKTRLFTSDFANATSTYFGTKPLTAKDAIERLIKLHKPILKGEDFEKNFTERYNGLTPAQIYKEKTSFFDRTLDVTTMLASGTSKLLTSSAQAVLGLINTYDEFQEDMTPDFMKNEGLTSFHKIKRSMSTIALKYVSDYVNNRIESNYSQAQRDFDKMILDDPDRWFSPKFVSQNIVQQAPQIMPYAFTGGMGWFATSVFTASSASLQNSGDAINQALERGMGTEQATNIGLQVFGKNILYQSLTQSLQIGVLGNSSRALFNKAGVLPKIGGSVFVAIGAGVEVGEELGEDAIIQSTIDQANGIAGAGFFNPKHWDLTDPRKFDTMMASLILGAKDPILGSVNYVRNQVKDVASAKKARNITIEFQEKMAEESQVETTDLREIEINKVKKRISEANIEDVQGLANELVAYENLTNDAYLKEADLTQNEVKYMVEELEDRLDIRLEKPAFIPTVEDIDNREQNDKDFEQYELGNMTERDFNTISKNRGEISSLNKQIKQLKGDENKTARSDLKAKIAKLKAENDKIAIAPKQAVDKIVQKMSDDVKALENFNKKQDSLIAKVIKQKITNLFKGEKDFTKIKEEFKNNESKFNQLNDEIKQLEIDMSKTTLTKGKFSKDYYAKEIEKKALQLEKLKYNKESRKEIARRSKLFDDIIAKHPYFLDRFMNDMFPQKGARKDAEAFLTAKKNGMAETFIYIDDKIAYTVYEKNGVYFENPNSKTPIAYDKKELEENYIKEFKKEHQSFDIQQNLINKITSYTKSEKEKLKGTNPKELNLLEKKIVESFLLDDIEQKTEDVQLLNAEWKKTDNTKIGEELTVSEYELSQSKEKLAELRDSIEEGDTEFSIKISTTKKEITLSKKRDIEKNIEKLFDKVLKDFSPKEKKYFKRIIKRYKKDVLNEVLKLKIVGHLESKNTGGLVRRDKTTKIPHSMYINTDGDFKGALSTVVIHEINHIAFNLITDADLKTLKQEFEKSEHYNEYLNKNGENIGLEEFFADEFSTYLHKEELSNKELKTLFDRLKDLFSKMINGLNLKTQTGQELKNIFDKFLDGKETIIKETTKVETTQIKKIKEPSIRTVIDVSTKSADTQIDRAFALEQLLENLDPRNMNDKELINTLNTNDKTPVNANNLMTGDKIFHEGEILTVKEILDEGIVIFDNGLELMGLESIEAGNFVVRDGNISMLEDNTILYSKKEIDLIEEFNQIKENKNDDDKVKDLMAQLTKSMKDMKKEQKAGVMENIRAFVEYNKKKDKDMRDFRKGAVKEMRLSIKDVVKQDNNKRISTLKKIIKYARMNLKPKLRGKIISRIEKMLATENPVIQEERLIKLEQYIKKVANDYEVTQIRDEILGLNKELKKAEKSIKDKSGDFRKNTLIYIQKVINMTEKDLMREKALNDNEEENEVEEGELNNADRNAIIDEYAIIGTNVSSAYIANIKNKIKKFVKDTNFAYKVRRDDETHKANKRGKEGAEEIIGDGTIKQRLLYNTSIDGLVDFMKSNSNLDNAKSKLTWIIHDYNRALEKENQFKNKQEKKVKTAFMEIFKIKTAPALESVKINLKLNKLGRVKDTGIMTLENDSQAEWDLNVANKEINNLTEKIAINNELIIDGERLNVDTTNLKEENIKYQKKIDLENEKKSQIELEKEPLRLSQLSALDYYINWKNVNIREDMKRQGISEEVMEKIETFLDDDVKRWGDWQHKNMYNDKETKNQLIETYNDVWLSTPQMVDDYYPTARVQRGKDPIASNDIGAPKTQQGLMAGFMKTRIVNDNPLILGRDTGLLLKNYIDNTAHFIGKSKFLKEFSSFMSNKRVTTAIKKYLAPKGTKKLFGTQGEFDLWLNDEKANTIVNYVNFKTLDFLRNNWASAKITGSVGVGLKQLISSGAFITEVPIAKIAEYGLDIQRNHQDYLDIREKIANLHTVKARYKDDAFQIGESDLKEAETNINILRNKVIHGLVDLDTILKAGSGLKSNAYDKRGDKQAVLFSGYFIYKNAFDDKMAVLENDNLTQDEKNKIADEYALNEVITQTNIAQQTGIRGYLQRWQKLNSFIALMTVFRTSPFRQAIKEIEGAIQTGKGIARLDPKSPINSLKQASKSKDIKQGLKKVFIYHFAMPMAFQFIGNIISALVGSLADDEDKLKKIWTENMKTTALLGSIRYVTIWGPVFSSIFSDYGQDELAPSMLSDLVSSGKGFVQLQLHYSGEKKLSDEAYLRAWRNMTKSIDTIQKLPVSDTLRKLETLNK